MVTSLQTILNSRLAVGLALAMGRALPPAAGRLLAKVAANRIADRRDSPMVRAVRANQWVVSGETLSSKELDQAVRETFRHSAICLYNLYHNLNNRESLLDLVELTPEADQRIKRSRLAGEAVMGVGVHMSNFDFILRSAALRGLKMTALAMSESPDAKGYEWQNQMRQNVGFEILPASMAALRVATERLEQGGIVMTGLDRPLPESKYRPRFFGRPAALPVMHVHLALKTGAPVAVVAGILEADGIYRIRMSKLIEMQQYPDKRLTITRNAETVLEVAEGYIREAPRQWLMFYPVWPEVMDRMP